MTFEELLDQALAMLQRRGRMTYRMLKLQFNLDDDRLEALKDELLYAHPQMVNDEGRGLVWTGEARPAPSPATTPPAPDQPQASPQAQLTQISSPSAAPRPPEAERRQLTVLFCDLVDSTVLASQLDPEEWREVVRAYQSTCAEVIQRFDGYIAQLLGDGLLVYFGYPRAHEDDAQRAVQASLGILEAMGTLSTRLAQDKNRRMAVRIGIHTGLVVVGEMGGGGRQAHLALGDTPNVAARLQGVATPDTIVISAATQRLVQGYFTMAALGPQVLKGVAAPVPVYRIVGAGAAQSRLEVAEATGWTPLVGRASEVALLLERWQQSQAGQGQVVLLSGEAGIGKSRLVEVLRQRVVSAGSPRIVLRCSPYHTHSALYPVIEYLQHVLEWRRDETPAATLDTLERTLQGYDLAADEAVPLVAALLSVPIPEGRYPPVVLTPPQQRQRTLDALTTWLLAEAERQPVLAVWEDVHWADPSTLELLGLMIDQVPTARMLTLVTARPEFRPPWAPRSHLTQLTLGRLPRPQVETMVRQLTGGKPLPAEVLTQVVAKTDGVPLFVEELVKMLLESGLVREEADRYMLTGPLPPLAIPATLQDSLMARLDRLSTTRAVAQLGAVLGRAFTYELIRAVAPLDEATVQRGLAQLVDAELLYQRGRPPQARYRFKHALIQETAYQSLLKSTRQQYHQRSAQVLAAQFPEIVETQPELVAQHYTEAGLIEQGIPYWRRAGQQAHQHSANLEAVRHLTKGLELLTMLPETPARAQQELDLQIALGLVLIDTKGRGAPEVEQTYARARALCQQVGDTPQLFSTLQGLCGFYRSRGALPTARELGEQLHQLALREADPTHRLEAHGALGGILFYLGEYAAARTYLEQGITLIDPTAPRALAPRANVTAGVTWCLVHAALTLWCLGYPAQALRRSQEALAVAQELAHPYSLGLARHYAASLHHHRRDASAVQAQAEALLTLATAHGFPLWAGFGTCWRGWALAMQGQGAAGLAQLNQGLMAVLATGQELGRPFCLVLLAEAAGQVGQVDEGLRLLAEALMALEENRRGDLLAEAYRLQGELLLRQAVPDAAQAEACFQQSLAIAHRQQAKSWELRAAMSLARLWQQQGQRDEARELLTPIYSWFTEGFDTADLQEAEALLEELSR
jgi:class 3 adenylate cyclase/predicted ATPase